MLLEVMKKVAVVVIVVVLVVTLVEGVPSLGPVTTDEGISMVLDVSSEGHTEALLRASRHDTLAFITIDGTFSTALDAHISKKDVLYIMSLHSGETINGRPQWKLSLGPSSWVLATAVTKVTVGSDAPVTWVVCSGIAGCAIPELERASCTAANTTTASTSTSSSTSLIVVLGASCGVLLVSTVLLALWLYRISRRAREPDSPMERFTSRSDALLLGAAWDPALTVEA